MNFDLNDDQRAIRETARGLLEQRFPTARVREAAEARAQDDALWAEMCELGWAGIAVPESVGGQGLGLVELCVLLEEQGAALSPTPLLPTVCAGRLILHGGSDEQRQRWLPQLASGAGCGAIGHSGRDTSTLVGAADPDVVAILEDLTKPTVSLLEPEPGDIDPVETIDPLRSYGQTSAKGQPLGGDVARGLDEAALCVSAELLGLSRRALEMTVQWVKERRQFGVPIGSFQAVSHKCAEMLFYVESARTSVYHAAWAGDADPQLFGEAAAIAKYVASSAGVAVTSAAIQAHGGVGFTWEADIHWWFKRAQVDAQLLGSASVHRARVGELALPVGDHGCIAPRGTPWLARTAVT